MKAAKLAALVGCAMLLWSPARAEVFFIDAATIQSASAFHGNFGIQIPTSLLPDNSAVPVTVEFGGFTPGAFEFVLYGRTGIYGMPEPDGAPPLVNDDGQFGFSCSTTTGCLTATSGGPYTGILFGPIVFGDFAGCMQPDPPRPLCFRAIKNPGALLFEAFNSTGATADAFLRITLGGIPEPSTWALMLAGFFGFGARLRSGRPVRVPALQA